MFRVSGTADVVVSIERSIHCGFGLIPDPGWVRGAQRIRREDLLTFFPNAGVLIGDRQEVRITPERINAIWNHPKRAGATPAFLLKSMINPTNG